MTETSTAVTKRKVRVGKVVSDKMDKTVVVVVDSAQRHRVYGKLVRRRERYKVHDAQNKARIGDVVRIEETRPLSRDKRWRITQILRLGTGELPAGEKAFKLEPEAAPPGPEAAAAGSEAEAKAVAVDAEEAEA